MITKFSGLGHSSSNGIDYNKLASGNTSSSRYMSKLASAESRGSIYMLKSNLRREIYKINKGDGDESQKRAAIARVRNVMKKADEKLIQLNHERRMKERIKQEKLAEDREEERAVSRRYKSKVYNRKQSERFNVVRAAVNDEKQSRELEYYKTYTDIGAPETPEVLTLSDNAAANASTTIDVMI